MPVTPAPVTPKFIGSTTLPVEQPDSGHYILDYKWKWDYKLKGDYATLSGQVNAGIWSRGQINLDFPGWIVGNAEMFSERGDVATIIVHYESTGGQLPPAEWGLDRENLQPHIERHPMFQALTVADFATVQRAFTAFTSTGQATALNGISSSANAVLANKLYEKLRMGYETYYMAGSRYWVRDYFLSGALPNPSNGGYIDFPGGPAGAKLPIGNSWLREADKAGQANYSPLGGVEMIEYSWIGGPNGWWDEDLYGS